MFYTIAYFSLLQSRGSSSGFCEFGWEKFILVLLIYLQLKFTSSFLYEINIVILQQDCIACDTVANLNHRYFCIMLQLLQIIWILLHVCCFKISRDTCCWTFLVNVISKEAHNTSIMYFITTTKQQDLNASLTWYRKKKGRKILETKNNKKTEND